MGKPKTDRTAMEIMSSQWYRESRQRIDRLSRTFEQQFLQPLIERTVELLRKKADNGST